MPFNRRIFLKIEAQHLLMSAHDADFCRRRAVRRDDAFVVNAMRREIFEQGAAMIIITDKTCYARLTFQKREVVRNIRTAAESLLCAHDMRNRHRRFWRNARDLSVVIFIEHDIADHQNFAFLRLVQHKIMQSFFIHLAPAFSNQRHGTETALDAAVYRQAHP